MNLNLSLFQVENQVNIINYLLAGNMNSDLHCGLFHLVVTEITPGIIILYYRTDLFYFINFFIYT